MSEPALELRALTKRYGDLVAVDSVDLSVSLGEFLTVLGPSGSGKTTVLRLVAGFVLPDGGSILLAGRDVSRMTPAERGIGMVFQQYALFPHMTVADNVAYGLKMRGWPAAKRHERVDEMLRLIGLQGLDRRMPRQLSGGQQQRVALARALAFGPNLLLMDEPLGALDRELRIKMAAELRRIHRELGTTMVYVTHDREEALTLSDQIAIMRLGKIEAVGTPQELFRRPSSAFVASFFGGHNLLPARIVSVDGGHATVECFGQTVCAELGSSMGTSGWGWLVVPHGSITFASHGGRELTVAARASEALYLGDSVEVTCTPKIADGEGELAGKTPDELLASVPAAEGGIPASGDAVVMHIDTRQAVVVPGNS